MTETPSSPPSGADPSAPSEADFKAMQDQLNALVSILPFANKEDVSSSLSMLSRYVETIRTKTDAIQADLNYKYELLVNRIIEGEGWLKKSMDHIKHLYAVLADPSKITTPKQ